MTMMTMMKHPHPDDDNQDLNSLNSDADDSMSIYSVSIDDNDSDDDSDDDGDGDGDDHDHDHDHDDDHDDDHDHADFHVQPPNITGLVERAVAATAPYGESSIASLGGMSDNVSSLGSTNNVLTTDSSYREWISPLGNSRRAHYDHRLLLASPLDATPSPNTTTKLNLTAFKLAAPQILDDDDSEMDLQEHQQPSQPFTLPKNECDETHDDDDDDDDDDDNGDDNGNDDGNDDDNGDDNGNGNGNRDSDLDSNPDVQQPSRSTSGNSWQQIYQQQQQQQQKQQQQQQQQQQLERLSPNKKRESLSINELMQMSEQNRNHRQHRSPSNQNSSGTIQHDNQSDASNGNINVSVNTSGGVGVGVGAIGGGGDIARRGSGTRRFRRISHAWGDLMHHSQVESSSSDPQHHAHSPFDMSARSEDIARSSAPTYDDSNNGGGGPPKTSKILQRMKRGLSGPVVSLSDYHASISRQSKYSTSRSGSRRSIGTVDLSPEELQVRKEGHQKRALAIIVVLICLLFVGAIVTVIVLLINNGNANDDGGGSPTNVLGLPISPTSLPTVSPMSDRDRLPSMEPTSTVAALPTTTTTTDPLNTLETIIARRRLVCGIIESPGLASRADDDDNNDADTGDWMGMDVDWCRALAAAVFGTDNGTVEYLAVSQSTRFATLMSGAVDVLAAGTTVTMERNFHEPTAQTGFSFSTPYLYYGLGFGGLPGFIDCAEAQDTETVTNATDCSQLSICVIDRSTHLTIIQQLIPNAIVVSKTSLSQLYSAFRSGDCNVVAGEQPQIAELVVRGGTGDQATYTGPYQLGSRSYSKEPIAMVTRNGDSKWTDFVNWIVQALFHAEREGIDQSTATSMGVASTVFGPSFTRSFVQAVNAVGNYGQVYERHMEAIVPRQPVNQIHHEDDLNGVIYSLPLGNLETIGPSATGTLAAVSARGFLRCGITRRTVFAEFNTQTQQWQGMDVDLCRAISAAIFDGIYSTIEYVDVPTKELLGLLEEGAIDVVARLSPITLERDVLDTTIGSGFSFSPPIFYDSLTFGGLAPYVDCANNLNSIGDPCQDLRVCVVVGTIYEQQSQAFFPERYFVRAESMEQAVQSLRTGECNVLSGGSIDVSADNVRRNGYQGTYETSTRGDGTGTPPVSSPHVPMAVVSRQDDAQWSAFLFWLVNSLMYAEEEGITQATSNRMPVVDLLGRRNFRIFRDAVAAVGSLAELYQRNAPSGTTSALEPRQGFNLLNTNPLGPQLLPYPGF